MTTFQRIEMLNGAQEYKKFTEELVRVSEAAKRRHLNLDMPTLILVTKSGLGNTTYLRLLTELIKEERLLPFSGEEDVFEWRLLETDEDPISRLVSRMNEAAGFYPYFSGVIGLELSDYHDFQDLPENLFDLIRENRKKTLFCLMITEKQALSFMGRLERSMRNYTQVRIIRLTATQNELCSYVREEFRRRGFIIRQELDDEISSFVETMGKGGYRSLNLAIDEVIWSKLNHNESSIIEAADLKLFLISTEDKIRTASVKQRLIGFGAHEI